MMEAWQQVAETCLGWLHPPEGPALRAAAFAAIDDSFELPLVEIGGYAGKSACWIGSAAQQANRVLFSVDWHRGSPEMAEGRECHHSEMVGKDGSFDSLPHFRANIRTAGLEGSVIPVAGRSEVVGRFWKSPICFLFIDGGHDGTSVERDFSWWYHSLVPGGYLLFHDTPIPEIGHVADMALSSGVFKLVEQVESLRILTRLR